MSKQIQYEGKLWSVKDLSILSGVHPQTLNSRLNAGMSVQAAMTAKVRPKKASNLYPRTLLQWAREFSDSVPEALEHCSGVKVSATQLSRIAVVGDVTLRRRLQRGWDLWQALYTPSIPKQECAVMGGYVKKRNPHIRSAINCNQN
ncbi:hypothetical protein [Vibrio phage V-YDF132]|nr:hypothetical protein [Vibrio phage V-YDF132]